MGRMRAGLWPGAAVVLMLCAACGSSSPTTGGGTSAGSSTPTAAAVTPTPLSAASGVVTLSGAVSGQLTMVVLCEPNEVNFQGTSGADSYVLSLGNLNGSHDAVLTQNMLTIDKWDTQLNASTDTTIQLTASGGRVNTDMPPDTASNVTGTVHASGQWLC